MVGEYASSDSATGVGANGEAAAPSTAAAGEVVGRVLGTQAASPLTFWVGLEPGRVLQLDDVVVVRRSLPGQGEVEIAGIVTAVEARHEGASFDSDVFLIAAGTLPAAAVESAEVTVTRLEPEIYVPPVPGSPASRAEGDDRDQALYFDTMESRLPVGLGRDGSPVYANFEFLDGTRGAHVSISGISGVATKTSFATWLLYSVFHSGVLGAEAANTKALVFSVKGEDLLFLDHANTRLDDRARERYARLGLPAEPFGSVQVFAPPRAGDMNATPHTSARTQGVSPFFWTLAEFCQGELLQFVFADTEDERAQYTMLVGQVASKLRRYASQADDAGAVQLTTDSGQHSERIATYEQLVNFLENQLTDDHGRSDWVPGSTTLGSINAFLRRLRSSVRPLSAVLRGDVTVTKPHSITTSDAQVSVVDLHNLPERAQRFVVGVALRGEFARKESSGTARPLLFVVLDELNKYAPREGDSPIKSLLLDIAERGRSLGVILVGAQQTASEVERRIVANSSLRVAGRLDTAEASRPEYGWLPSASRARATFAKPGTMFVSQPELPVPLAVEFPFPAWATRPGEKGEPVGRPEGPRHSSHGDPFAGLPGQDEDKPPF